MAEETGASTIEEIERTPAGKVRRWTSEIDTAERKAKEWRENVQKVWDLYRSKKPADNTFNIFWSNVETLRPALYNSSPRPDVRRRFRDADPVGKVVAQIIERTLTFSVDKNDFDFRMQMLVLDVNIVGRGLSRIRYEPVLAPMEGGETVEDDWLAVPTEQDEAGEKEPVEEVVDESTPVEHVSWNRWLHGEAKNWAELPWMAFEHDMQYDQLVQYFGEAIARAVPLTKVSDDVTIPDKDVRSTYKTAKVYEIWDKRTRTVLFICPGYKPGPLKEVPDPLRVQGFWPMPRPVYAIEDSETLEPAIPYIKYEQQARELNRVTRRINKVVEALKVRGAYSGSLSEVSKIIEAQDNQMVAIENASEIAAMGGLDKAIWIMPIDKLTQVLAGLYESRAAIIQSIYEITGLGDVMRGVSNPHETLGAQKIKSQWGTLRLQRLQREIQRFIRDLMRLEAEVVGEHFSWDTLSQITGIKLLTVAQKQQITAAMQPQMGLMGQQAGPSPQVPPELQKLMELPSVEDVMALLKGDALRQYRIDVETDSTVAETLSEDTQALQEVLTAIGGLFTAAGPAIVQGLLSVDVVKTLAIQIARRAKMGQAVEDAIDQIKQPPPQPQGGDPEAAKKMVADLQGQLEQATKASQTAQQRVQQLEADKVKADIEAKKTQVGQVLKEQHTQIQQQIEQQKQSAEAELLAKQEELKNILQQIQDAKHDLELKHKDMAVTQAKLGAQETNIDAKTVMHGAAIKTSQLEQQKNDAEKAVEEADDKESKTAEGLVKLESIVEKLASTVEQIAETQAKVVDAQAETTAELKSMQQSASKPRTHTAVKKDGKWTIQSS